ncbi:preprotein translocase subunit SecE [Patescibacteria group bacterium]|nr:preprotein translocase subunit SecE [Patescibacteria group bacterium]
MRRIITFIQQTWTELGKVVWPTRRRTIRLTGTVIIVAIFFGAFIGAVDYGLTKGLEAVITTPKKTPAKSITVPGSGGQQPIQIPAGGNQPANQPQSK